MAKVTATSVDVASIGKKNDVMVMPNFLWRRHVNTGKGDAILYTVSDAALMRNIGQYRAQGKERDGTVTQIVA